MTDYGFKKIFGHNSNKPFLINYLNSLIELETPIKTLQYLPTEHIGKDILDRIAIFDLLVESESGEKILIELQQVKQKNYPDRALFYSTSPIQSQAQKGIWNYQLKKVYIIGILNFCLDKSQEYLSTKMILDIKTNAIWTDRLQFINIEIPKFDKDLDECFYAHHSFNHFFQKYFCEAFAYASQIYGIGTLKTSVPVKNMKHRKGMKLLKIWNQRLI